MLLHFDVEWWKPPSTDGAKCNIPTQQAYLNQLFAFEGLQLPGDAGGAVEDGPGFMLNKVRHVQLFFTPMHFIPKVIGAIRQKYLQYNNIQLYYWHMKA